MNGAHSGLANTIRNLLVAGGSAMILAGCLGGGGGGGGGSSDDGSFSGNTDPASVSSQDDAAAVSYAATEGAYQAINSETTSLPTAAVIQSTNVEDELTADLLELIEENEQLSLSPTAATTLLTGDCGGEVRFDSDDEQNSNPDNGTVEFSYTYDSYCITSSDGGQITTDGTGDYTATYENGQLVEYSMTWDLTYTLDDGQTIVSELSGTTTCDFSDNTFSCTFSDDFTGPNGETYRVENVSVSEDNNGNYGVSARVYDGDLGYVDFEASDINRRDCDNGNFQGGTITITDGEGNTIEVQFTNCNDCVVTFNGVSNTYDQPDRT